MHEPPSAVRGDPAADLAGAHHNKLDLAASYNQYYGSGLYARRYPRPNPNMARMLRRLLPSGGKALDFGCGNGRYIAPLLKTGADIIAYDISEVAVREVRHRHGDAVAAGRLRPICGALENLTAAVPARSLDLVAMMFGVLGHIRGAAVRQQTLRCLSRLLRPGGFLVATVPNATRRFAAEQMACAPWVARGDLEEGDILYQRHTAEGPVEMYYQMFTPPRFTKLLNGAGLEVKILGAESIMPERAVLGLPFGDFIDRTLMRVWPFDGSYGFVAVATPRHPD
jgi:SAM-dependent methyltransferase